MYVQSVPSATYVYCNTIAPLTVILQSTHHIQYMKLYHACKFYNLAATALGLRVYISGRPLVPVLQLLHVLLVS